MTKQKASQLLLADVENLAGTASPLSGDVVEIRRQVHHIVERKERSLLSVVACSHHAAGVVRFAWPDGLHSWRSGRDGADLQLLQEVNRVSELGSRFERVIIASGDAIFAPLAAGLQAVGVEVLVIVGRGGLAKRLRLAAGGRVKRLDLDPQVEDTRRVA